LSKEGKALKLKEKCGIVALSTNEEAMPRLILGLSAIQHRGQEAAGITIFDPDTESLEARKGLGLVNEVFPKDTNKLNGGNGIGHVYYSLQNSTPENAQPYMFSTSEGKLAIAHNGIIVNSKELKQTLMKRGHNFSSGSEEESMAYILAEEFSKSRGIPKAIKSMMKLISGSYTLALMFEDRVFAVRDPLGIRPLCLGKLPEGGYIIASETIALNALGAEYIRDVAPGEAVELTKDRFTSHQLVHRANKAHCFFEWVYFAAASSILDGSEVYEARRRIGWRCAKEHPVEADVVIPLPDSGRAHAYGYSLGSGIPMVEGLIKNRFSSRSFIIPTQKDRDFMVRLKLNPVRKVVEGKRVVLVDDSIVRGTTMRRIVKMLRKTGAKEVHVRIGSPPIVAPCYLGIDMTKRDELIASTLSIEEIREHIGCDTLGYISIEGLTEALEMNEKNLCLGCVTEEYPVPVAKERYRFQTDLTDF